MSGRPRRVAIALGSNIGDRRGHLNYAVTHLRRLLADPVVSAFVDTAPHGVGTDQPMFLNAVAVGWSTGTPDTLLSQLRAIEDARGRERPFSGAPRTLDLDLIMVGEIVLSTDELVVPHPRFRNRRFVLGPLVSIAPELVDPVTGLTVRELLGRLEAASLES